MGKSNLKQHERQQYAVQSSSKVRKQARKFEAEAYAMKRKEPDFLAKFNKNRPKHRKSFKSYIRRGRRLSEQYSAFCKASKISIHAPQSALEWFSNRLKAQKDKRKITKDMTLDEYLDLPNLKNITSSTVDLSNLTSAYSIENNGKSNPFMSDEVLNLRFQAVSTNESVPQRAVILSPYEYFVILKTMLDPTVLAPKNGYRTAAVFATGVALVWRISEVLNLDKDKLVHGYQPVEDKYKRIVDTESLGYPIGKRKTDKGAISCKVRWVIPTENPYLNIIGLLARYHEEVGIKNGPCFQRNSVGSRLDIPAFNKDLAKVAQHINSEKLRNALTSHSCRRTGATFMLSTGSSPEELKFCGGWSSGAYLSYIDEDIGAVHGSAAGNMAYRNEILCSRLENTQTLTRHYTSEI